MVQASVILRGQPGSNVIATALEAAKLCCHNATPADNIFQKSSNA